MQKTRTKITALLICVMMLVQFVPTAFADTGYTEQYLGDGFTRLVLTDTAFAAQTARTFTVNIEEDSDYTVFLNRTETPKSKSNFIVSFTNGTKTVTLANPTSVESAYNYSYVRVGAGSNTAANSVALTKGEWTMSVTSIAATTIDYIDIRSTIINVDGSKQAVYPSDFNSYSQGPADYVNRQLNDASYAPAYAKVEDYTYWADYENENLATQCTYGRGIQYKEGKTITYKFNVAKAGTYIIKMSNKYRVISNLTAETTGILQVTANNDNPFEQSCTFASGTNTSARTTLPLEYEVNLAAGVNTLTLKMKSAVGIEFYINSLTIEEKVIEYTEQYLGDGFTRLNLNNTAFEAKVAREFTVNIPKDGDYAVFIDKEDNGRDAFGVSFTNGTTTKTLTSTPSKDASAYMETYVRVGAAAIGNSTSVSLTEGEWTMSVYSINALNINFIDIRSTTIDVDGSKQAIYPSDYNTYVTNPNTTVNNQMKQPTYSKVSNYTYYGDYSNPSLAVPFDHGRGIKFYASSNTITYKLNVATAGSYVIKMNAKFIAGAALSSETTAALQLTATDNEPIELSHTFSAGTSSGSTSSLKESRYKVTLGQGVNTLTVKMADSSVNVLPQIYSLTISSADNDAPVYSLVLDNVSNYMAAAKTAYASEEYADYTTSIIKDYSDKLYVGDIPKPVTLAWSAISGATSYTLYVSTSDTFPEGSTHKFENITTTSKDIYNLFINTKYYWKVTGNNGTSSDIESFTTANTIRYMNVDGADVQGKDGIRNVRDIGGWNGLNQGLAYRGTEMNASQYVPHYGSANPKYFNITDAGKKVMLEDMGIKTDIDLRGQTETGNITQSPLGETVNWVNCPIGSYHTFAYKEGKGGNRQKIFELFADPDNYPIYFHCFGGSDRTGTIAFLMEAIAGASEVDLNIDYEATSFSILGARTRVDGGYYFASLMNGLKAYEGDTLQEKAENYAINCVGISRSHVSNIQSILSGNGVVFENPSDVQIGANVKIKLKNLNGHTVKSVATGATAATYALSGDVLTMALADAGTYTITLDDDTTLKFEALESTPCTQQNLEDSFTRLTLDEGNQSFLADSTRSLVFDVEEDGNYAVFMSKTAEANGFTATLTNGTTTYTLSTGDTANSDYAYPYVRLGTQSGSASSSYALTAGEWKLNITPVADTTVAYVDIRSTDIDINGYPQAIYAADYSSYSLVSAGSDVNGKMNTNIVKTAGYSYYGDYADSELASAWNYNRAITLAAGTTVNYQLNTTVAAGYALNIDGATENITVSIDGHTVPVSATDKGVKCMAQLSVGTHTIAITATQDTDINALRFEKVYGSTDILVNAETDFDKEAGHNVGWYDTTPEGYDDQWMDTNAYSYVDVTKGSSYIGGGAAFMVGNEWFRYKINADYSGYYRLILRYSECTTSFTITVNDDAPFTKSIPLTYSIGSAISEPWVDYGFIWLNKGENTIKIKYGTGSARFDAFRLVCPDAALYQMVESEVKTKECEDYTDKYGASDKETYVLAYPGSWIKYTINADTAGIYDLTLYANGGNEAATPTVKLTVNDKEIGTVNLTNSNSWSSTGANALQTKFSTIELKAGENTIMFSADGETQSYNYFTYSTSAEQKVMDIGAGTYTVKVDLDNWYSGTHYNNNSTTPSVWTADTIENLTFIAAVYNGDELVKAEIKNVADINSDNMIIIENFTLQDGETVKLFVWDNSSSDLKPMLQSIIYE